MDFQTFLVTFRRIPFFLNLVLSWSCAAAVAGRSNIISAYFLNHCTRYRIVIGFTSFIARKPLHNVLVTMAV